jgi:rubredoxin
MTCACDEKTKELCAHHAQIVRDEVAYALKIERDARAMESIPMRIPCPECKALHVDEGELATKTHHTHACQHCGAVFRNAIVNTVDVRFLPGFKKD